MTAEKEPLPDREAIFPDTMERTPEPELMDDPEQALAYARADFAEPHNYFIEQFRRVFPDHRPEWVLDLGCGPGDICRRFALAYPDCHIHGVDGAAAMLEIGREDTAATALEDRIELLHGYLPDITLPRTHYDTLISNSLLHHLRQPQALWEALKRFGTAGSAVFVMDLLRPPSEAIARQLVDTYAMDEPPILRHDFYHSLLAAYTAGEVGSQLAEAGLQGLSFEVISDRHWLVYGRL